MDHRSRRTDFAIPWMLLLLLSSTPLEAEDISLIRIGEPWRFIEATQRTEDWIQPGFDDVSWTEGRSGFSLGYGSYDEATTLPFTLGLTYRFRKRFQVENLASIQWLILRLDYRDGLVAYLNGKEFLRRGLQGVSGTPVAPETAALSRIRAGAEDIDISEFKKLLVAGENILAIQVHGWTSGAYGLALAPELLANFNRGPFLQSATESSIKVVWRTPKPTEGFVVHGPTSAGPWTTNHSAMATEHAVLVPGLNPGELRHYRIESRSSDGAHAVSALSTFKTAKASGDFRLAVIGDSGVGSLAQLRVADLLRAGQPDIVLHTGDIIYPDFHFTRADLRCLSVYGRHMRTTPYYFAIGNHDLYSGPQHFRDTFHFPTNSVFGNEDFYSFDHADLHVAVVLVPYFSQYAPTPGDPQHRWLEQDLAASKKPWKIIIMHHPMMTSSAHRFDDYNFNRVPDRDETRDYILPLATRYGVQLVFSGHDHVFERFNPTRGVHAFVTGGGGVYLYGLTSPDAASAQLYITHHAIFVTATNQVMRVRGIDSFQREFDYSIIGREAPAPQTFLATRETIGMETGPANDDDGNIRGQSFGFRGSAIPAKAGQESNLGELRVSHDGSHLFLGLSSVMLYPHQEICLFLQHSRVPGVPSLAGLGNGKPDPFSEGADALDFLEELRFEDFAPSLALVLGDEFADSTLKEFQRPGMNLPGGQGAFLLKAGFPSVSEVSIQQFNRSPQSGTVTYERNADFIKVAIPLTLFGGIYFGDEVKVAAVVASDPPEALTRPPARVLDTGFHGHSLRTNATGQMLIKPLTVALAPDRDDPDDDGLRNEDELLHDTNPNVADSDGDGLPDGWEVRYGSNPLVADAHLDPDLDSMSNWAEFRAGTDPRSGASRLTLSATLLPTGLELRWTGAPGRSYILQEALTPAGPYTDLLFSGFPRLSQGGEEIVRIIVPQGFGRTIRFLRLRMTP